MKKKWKYVVTHGGDAHWDDILSVGVALYYKGVGMPVYRRNPTPEELDDPDVLVLDVGRRLEPEKGNFDHHQLPQGTLECALTLFLRNEVPALYNILSTGSNILDVVSRMDNLGPFKFNKNGRVVDMTILEPLDAAIRRRFEDNGVDDEVDIITKEVLICIVREHIRAAQQTLAAVEIVKAAKRFEVFGCKVVWSDSDHQKFKHALDSVLEENYDILILPDTRGSGWMLFRNKDHPRVDFRRVENDPRVTFAHRNGFVAKTYARVDYAQLLELLGVAIRPE